MSALTHTFDLAGMRLRSGEGRRLLLSVPLQELQLGGETYRPQPEVVQCRLEVSRMVGQGYALTLTFAAALRGPCMRCLTEAAPTVQVQAREVQVPGGGEAMDSPYVQGESLDLAAWAHDAFVLAAPVAVLCRPDCRGLCPECAANLNQVQGEHTHERPRDARWAKLDEIRLD